MDKKPNILLIMTDQHRYECLGCHGHPLVKTPNIDRLAADGVDFQRAYSQSAICMPSRVSVLTGQYLHTHGIQGNSKFADVRHLTMLPNVLRKQGYQTAAVGKTHAGPCEDVGFEHYRLSGGLSEGETSHYREYLKERGLTREGGADRAMKAYDAYVSELPYEHTLEAWTGDESLAFLKQRDARRPFFLWATFDRPHPAISVPKDNPFPYDPDRLTLDPYDERWYTGPDTKRPGCENMWNVFHTGEGPLRQAIANYYTLISMIDDQVGRLLNALEETGQMENTIVVFTADHGEFAGKHGQFGKNVSTFDVLYRVPFIWHWKGVTGREQIHELVELVDTMPTFLDLIGVACPRTVQGRSLAPVLRGSAKRGGIPWEGKEAVFFETPFVKTVRTKTHKLSWCFKGSRSWGQLYDLVEDPDETRNRCGDPAFDWVQRDLERRLLNWMIETQQPQTHGAGLDTVAPDGRWYGE